MKRYTLILLAVSLTAALVVSPAEARRVRRRTSTVAALRAQVADLKQTIDAKNSLITSLIQGISFRDNELAWLPLSQQPAPDSQTSLANEQWAKDVVSKIKPFMTLDQVVQTVGIAPRRTHESRFHTKEGLKVLEHWEYRKHKYAISFWTQNGLVNHITYYDPQMQWHTAAGFPGLPDPFFSRP